MSERNLPTYILSPEECPPDDDRRHGCGICHRRFNRPSSLRIHMNSHTGDQPFECPYPGCSRRFSVNSNMRRHYRNHRDGHSLSPPLAYPPLYYRNEPPNMLYRINSSPSSSSATSFSDNEDHDDSPVISTSDRRYQLYQGRTRSVSEVYPPRQDRPSSRVRSCTISGCDCREAPAVLRPAFPQGSTSAPTRSR
ncbi:hypothetical protein OH77DRAFT_1497920 [Trametes cingulata]|nr:hypothetical protein OH77DRAFT_1497920 [Trametes cingulata]